MNRNIVNSNLIYNRRKNMLKTRCDLNKLESYYNINNFNISLQTIDETNDNLHIKYEQFYNRDEIQEIKHIFDNNILKCENLYLPIEINSIIYNYIQKKEYTYINININCSQKYPFRPLYWTLIDTHTNINSPNFNNEQLNEYFKFKVESFNKQLKEDLSSILHVDGEIILFISQMNDSLDYFTK